MLFLHNRGRPLVAPATTQVMLGPPTKARSARRSLERRRPQSQDIGRCSPTSCGREGAVQRERCQSYDRCGGPRCAASNACHFGPIPSQYCQPSDVPAGRIVVQIGEGGHEVDLGRDIESPLSRPFSATLQWYTRATRLGVRADDACCSGYLWY